MKDMVKFNHASQRGYRRFHPKPKKIQCWAAMLCLAIVLQFILGPAATTAQAADDAYLLDRTVQWDDGSTEHVQIDTNGNIYLDGQRRNLVGMDIGGCDLTRLTASQLAVVDKELAYLQSIGVRVVACEPGYIGLNRESENHILLDMAKEHKMFVFARIGTKWLSGFDNLTNLNFTFGGDTLDTWVPRWCNYIKNNYPNVISVCVENEIDMRSENNHSYTPQAAAAYMQKLVGLLRANISLPLYTKLVGDFWYDLPASNQIKDLCWNLVDIVAWDIYRPSVSDMTSIIGTSAGGTNTIAGRMASWGYTKQWWVGETNACTDDYSDVAAADFTPAYLDAEFNKGCSVAFLWTSCVDYDMPNSLFFDSNGNPIPSLRALASELSRLQAPISTPITTPTPELIKSLYLRPLIFY